MAYTPHIPAPEAFTALRIIVEEHRDRLFSSMRLNDPQWISGMRSRFIEQENKYIAAGDPLQADLFRALAHAALRLHQTAHHNKIIADECRCFDEVMLTTCHCPYQQVDFDNENTLLQDVITHAVVKDWERRGIPSEEARVAVALANPIVLGRPHLR